MKTCPRKFRIAVPSTERLFTYPSIGFSSLAQTLWDTTDNRCEILKLHESELLTRDDYDVVFLIRNIGTNLLMRNTGTNKTFLEHLHRAGKRIAIWRDDLHWFRWRVPYPPKKLVQIFDRVDLIFVTSLHHFYFWKPYRRFKDKVVWSPWSVPDWIFELSKPWGNRKSRILLSGMCSMQYPLRKRLFKYTRKKGNSFLDSLRHPSYAIENRHKGLTGKSFYNLLCSYKGAIATTASARLRIRRAINYTVLKYIEIPACGCLPFMEVTPDLRELGFVDGLNFISITCRNYGKRLSFIHSREAEEVARAAQDLIRNRHTHKHRIRLIIDNIADLMANK